MMGRLLVVRDSIHPQPHEDSSSRRARFCVGQDRVHWRMFQHENTIQTWSDGRPRSDGTSSFASPPSGTPSPPGGCARAKNISGHYTWLAWTPANFTPPLSRHRTQHRRTQTLRKSRCASMRSLLQRTFHRAPRLKALTCEHGEHQPTLSRCPIQIKRRHQRCVGITAVSRCACAFTEST